MKACVHTPCVLTWEFTHAHPECTFGHIVTNTYTCAWVHTHPIYARVCTQSYLCLFSHHTQGLGDTGVFSQTPTSILRFSSVQFSSLQF